MNIEVLPRKLSGEIQAISSKSYAQRILLACSLCEDETFVKINHFSEDIKHCIKAISAFGAKTEFVENGVKITPSTPIGNINIFCGESGTTARMILPIATAICKNGGVLEGCGSLLNRPFEELCNALSQNGVEFSSNKLPIKFSGKLNAGDFYIAGNQSSQYISGLMLALPLLESDSSIILTSPLQSSGYINMTLEILNQFGVSSGYEIKGGQKYISPKTIEVEGDWSNASYWIAAGIFPSGLNKNSLQKDSVFPKICDLDEIDAMEIPDLVPALSIYAAKKETDTVIYNINRLRIKESDRVVSIEAMIKSLGGEISVEEDKMIIHGTGGLHGGVVKSYNDHRIVMSAAVASCFCKESVIIHDAHSVDKSYPNFFKDLEKLGGEYRVL